MMGTSLVYFFHLSLFIVPYLLIFQPTDVYGYSSLRIYFQVAVPIFGLWFLVDLLVGRKSSSRRSPVSSTLKGAVRALWSRCRALPKFLQLGLAFVGLACLLILLSRVEVAWILSSVLLRPVYFIGIFYALKPTGLLLVATGVALSLLLFRHLRPRGMLRRWPVLVVYVFWVTTCFSVLFLQYFRSGPSKDTCEEVYKSEGVIPIFKVSRYAEMKGLEESMPYDVVVDAGLDLAFISHKRVDGRRGGISRIDLTGELPLSTLMIEDERGRNLFPERMAIDPKKQEVYTLVLGATRHSLHVARYGRDVWKVDRLIPLEGEANRIFVDPEQARLVVLFAGANADGLAVFDTDTWEIVRRIGSDQVSGCCQFAVLSKVRNRFYFGNIGPYSLYELDGGVNEVIRKRWSKGLALIGIALRENPFLLYASSPLTHDVKIIDPTDLKIIGTLEPGGGLADIAVDEKREVLYAGLYGGDFVTVSLETGKIVRRYFLGKMLRGIYFDRGSGRVFACSGCGVFEILNNDR